MLGLVIFGLLLFMMLLYQAAQLDFKVQDDWLRIVTTGAVFTMLLALPLQAYPAFDEVMFNALPNNGFYLGFTQYSLGGYGAVHWSSVSLVIFMALAWAMTPAITDIIYNRFGGLVGWYLDKIMIDEFEGESNEL